MQPAAATNQRTQQSPNSEIKEGEDHAADPPSPRQIEEVTPILAPFTVATGGPATWKLAIRVVGPSTMSANTTVPGTSCMVTSRWPASIGPLPPTAVATLNGPLGELRAVLKRFTVTPGLRCQNARWWCTLPAVTMWTST